QGVRGDAKHPEFPGYQADRGFFSHLEFDDDWNEKLTQTEMQDILTIRSSRERFETLLALLDDKMRLLAEQDYPPQYVVVGLPDELLRRSRVVNYQDKDLGSVHRDLRRAFKALVMKYRIPTQLFRQPTMEGKDKDHPSKIAWNFFTGLYFKAGGAPWSPVGLLPGTCYIGIDFYRPLGSQLSVMQTSLVQAFDEHGEGLVLRGHDFEWDQKQHNSRSPHLTEDQAAALIDMVLTRYQQEMKQSPRRVVVHKSSQYWPQERAGFSDALRERVSQFDLLALAPQSKTRLITTSKYPPLRGTSFSVGDLDFLYTTGFIAALNEFHGMHVPSPIRISDHVGQDTSRDVLLKEILILTKMNWNSAHLGGLRPITLKFSDLVGSILREIPNDREPLPQFKFYM
ncbi:MAG: hypothetical protein M3R24_11760, partial [Chloroflexota bacterium]|nr:hypothetical protein [Chloroflexota bacterium]